MFDTLSQDVRLAARALWRKPGVTLAALLSLALGIGVNVAIFSVFEQVLLRRLPVREPGELVTVTSPGPRRGRTSSDFNLEHAVFSYPLFRDLERIQTGFTGIAAFRDFRANLAYGDQSTAGEGILVSGDYFPVLGLQPAAGRLLARDDDRVPGAPDVVVLSHAYWTDQFGASPSALGDRLIVNGRPMTIVGVAPRGFLGTARGTEPDVFVPLTMAAAMQPGAADLARNEGLTTVFENRRDHWLYVFGRLEPGLTREAAQTRLDGPFARVMAEVDLPAQGRMTEQLREQFLARRILLDDGSRGHETGGDQRPLLRVLFAITGLVLLIACANVANLLLARAADRAADVAVHVSMGATPRRIVHRLVTEAALLALAGGAAGLLVGAATLRLLAAVLPSERFELNLPVLVFTLALSLATALLFGVAPAVHALRAGLATVLKRHTPQASGSRTVRRFGSALATAQVALAAALLVVTGLFAQSLVNVGRVSLGLEPDGVVAFRVYPRLNGYDPQRAAALIDRLEDELRGVPGVSSVGVSSVPLLTGNNNGSNVTVEGYDGGLDVDTSAVYSFVGPDFFRTLGIPLLAGRELLPGDTAASPKVAVVNEAFAKKFGLWPDVVGKRMRIGSGGALDIEIVGLAADAHYSEVKAPPPPQFFTPQRQHTLGGVTFYARTGGSSAALLAEVPALVRRVDATLPVQDLMTMPEQVSDNVARDRLLTTLSSSFGVLATLLAALGLYGVLAYAVAQRRREIGIRMAVGATLGRIRALVFTQLLPLVLIGCATGLLAAIGLERFVRSLLFGVEGAAPGLVAAVAAVILTIAAAAAFVPLRRAVQIDPVAALRTE